MNYENQCSICGAYGTELHHIQYRSQVPTLKDCPLNHVYLCPQHHRDGRAGVHFNKELDNKLKLRFQNTLEILWDKEYLSRQDVKEVLKIKDKPLGKLLKTVISKNGEYERESLIRSCCGGRLSVE